MSREHAPRPGTRWETVLRTTGEVVIADGPWDGPANVRPWTDGPPIAEPRPNRAARRAAQRKERRR